MVEQFKQRVTPSSWSVSFLTSWSTTNPLFGLVSISSGLPSCIGGGSETVFERE